jgi:hypothetical protein
MDQTDLIEDIITTKNTLKILHRVFIVNQIVLQPFAPIFDLIKELIDILTHSSATQIETVLLSTGSEFVFKKLKETLNELSDAITTKNTSTINSLNEQLNSCAQKLRTCSSYAANNEETADDIFKKQLLQSHIDAKARSQSEYLAIPIPISDSEYDDVQSSLSCELEQDEEKSSTMGPFALFRFARRKHSSISSKRDKGNSASVPAVPPKP